MVTQIVLDPPTPNGFASVVDDGVRVQTYTITPEKAREWLDGPRGEHFRQRPLNQATVSRYARDMANGDWNFDASMVCLSPDGILLNGQHRLHAIIRAGRPVKMTVATNVPESAGLTMDAGKNRSAADALAITRGVRRSAQMASLAKMLVLIQSGLITRDNKLQQQAVTHTVIAQFVDAHMDDMLYSVQVTDRFKRQVDCPPTAFSVAHYMIAEVNGREWADLYVTALGKKVNEPEGSAVLAVDNRLRNARSKSERHPDREIVSLLIRGWNHWSVGSRPKSMVLGARKGEQFVMPEVRRVETRAA